MSSHVLWITSYEFWWYDITSLIYFYSAISSFILILDSISIYFLLINYFTRGTFSISVDTRKSWIPYKIFSVWCIQIIWFITVEIWVNSSKYPLRRNVQNLPSLFSFLQHNHHNYLFYLCKIVPQCNRNWKLNIEKPFNIMSIECRLIVW